MPRGVYVRKKGFPRKSFTVEHCRRIAESKLGNKNALGHRVNPSTFDHLKNVAASLRGVPLSEEHKRKVSLAKLGKLVPKISIALSGRKLSPEHINSLRVAARNPKDTTIKIRSLNAIRLHQEGILHNTMGNAQWFIDRLGRRMYLRSSWEFQFAQWLDSKLLTWDYEPIITEVDNLHHRLPDFYVHEWGCYIEIKPWYRRDEAYDMKRLLECVHGKKCLIVTELPTIEYLESWYTQQIA